MHFPDNVIFKEKQVKISPTQPELPSIYPSSFKICGKVTLSAKNVDRRRKISVKSSTFEKIVDTDPESGNYCLFLVPGDYEFNVVVNEEEKNEGLQ